MSKYYVVLKGITPGIYRTWNECNTQVKGYKGAIYKSFTDETTAKQYYNQSFNNDICNFDYYIYTDGSYSDNKAGYAWVLANLDRQILQLQYGPVIHNKITNNVGELFAIYKSLEYISKTESSYLICMDSLTSLQTIQYINSIVKHKGFDDAMNIESNRANIDLYRWIIYYINNTNAKIQFKHVYGHSGDELNEYVDKYANLGRISVMN